MQVRPEGDGDAESQGEALDGSESAQKAVGHAPEMGEVIDKGGEADYAVDNYIKKEPVQHLDMTEAHPLV